MEREGDRHIPVVYSVSSVSCESNHSSFLSINKTEERMNGCWKAVMDHPVFAMMHYNKGRYDSSPQCDTIHDIPDATHICGLLLCTSYLGAGVGWVGQLTHQSALWREGNTRLQCQLPCTTPRRKSCCRLPLQLAITANFLTHWQGVESQGVGVINMHIW